MEKVVVKLSVLEDEKSLISKVSKKLKTDVNKLKHFKIIKKSLDARDKNNIFYHYTVEAGFKAVDVEPRVYPKINCKPTVLVVGLGPSGLFCALDLVRYGFDVTVIERGKDVDERKKSLDSFISTSVLDENSNMQFGEGGAGMFSDGKLNTQVGGKFVKEVIDDFVTFGAPSEIAYLNKPHIGSDNLPNVVKNIRNEIIRLGGKVLFNTALTDIKIANGKVSGVYINGNKFNFDEVVLAVGHSARDVYQMMINRGVFIESKDFAVGFRIEHLAKDINLSQYGAKYINCKNLPTADYKLVSHAHHKGVFTFCMCPGGHVMPSSSEKGGLVVNGMSNFARNGENSNSAVVVQTDKSDYGDGVLDGVNFQRQLEQNAFNLGGGGFVAPVQLVKDYLLDRKSTAIENVAPSYVMGYKLTNLNGLLPQKINDALKLGIKDMATKLKGFDGNGGVLTAVESRTSSPVRITRTENLNSLSATNLYPCGEGCGYAGGITSAGADGKRVAFRLFEKYFKGL